MRLQLTVILMLRGAAMVSVDPDMELPVRADTEEDIFIFNSMNINPLDVRVNYRGQPHRHPQLHLPHHETVAETDRGGGDGDRQLVHKVGEVSPHPPPTPVPTLSPGAGSWMFNSIESRARHGLTPTHVPGQGEMASEASESVLRVEVTSPSTIPQEYKDILSKSEDYKRWVNLKNNFLRRQKKLQSPKNLNKVRKTSGNVKPQVGGRDDAKFPNFPGSYEAGETEVRPPRQSLHTSSSPAVFKEGGTLYRAKSSTPTRTVRPRPTVKPVVKVSSLKVSTVTPYTSPLYPNTPYYSTPQPPLPPGYELVPVDQLTEDHEVVPWEDLPHLMRKHNMSLNHIPLGPFQHSTTAAPFTVFSSAPKYSSTSPSPVPVYTKSVQSFTTAKPFTAFSSKPSVYHRPPYIPPPVSPELGNSLIYGGETKLRHPVTVSTKSKPKSIHFGTHFGPLPGQVSSTAGPAVVSNTFRYNPTTGPSSELLAHTPSLTVVSHPTPPPTLGRFSPFPSPTPGYSQIGSSTKYPVFTSSKYHQKTPLYTPSTVKYHPTPTTAKYHPTTSPTIKYHYTPTTVKYPPTPSTIKYNPTPTTVKYHKTPSTVKYHKTPSTTSRYSGYQSTSELTQALLKYSTLAPQPPSTVKPTEPPRADHPPMPKFLAPPNKQLPTYFDVAVPVAPSPPPPPVIIPARPAPPLNNPVPIFQVGDNSLAEPSTTTTVGPIVLQGRLRNQAGQGDSTAPQVVFPSNVNRPQDSTDSPGNTLDSHPARLQNQHEIGQFEHFTQKSSKVSQERPSSRLVALTTMRPELATKHNPNKMRSSTHRNQQDKDTRFRPRPLSPNFHPIRPRPTPMSRLVPQIRPKVPGSETESGSEVHDTHTDTAVISNNNNGVWFIQEKMKESEGQVKREFSQDNKTTINPALTEKPRTWPSTLKSPRGNNIYDDVSIVERGKSGQLEQGGSSRESTTFTTSRVEMSVSTTPGPSQLVRMDDAESQSNSALKELMINKAQKLLESLSNKEKKFERMDEMGNIRPQGKRRKKFKVQPKALAGPGVHTVFPMDKAHTQNKPVDEIFKSHPGLKRISAYDFERAMARGENPLSITKPVAELKVSIEELANTMNQLNRNVLETSTKAEPKDAEDDKITQLQEEIAKLTKTLETLRLSPKSETSSSLKEMKSTMRSIISSTGRPVDISSPRIDFQESESVNTWLQAPDKNVIDANRRKVGTRPNKLDIIEVYTRATPVKAGMGLSDSNQVTRFTPRPTTSRTTTTTTRTTRPPVQVTPMRVETSDDDIINFFGSPTEKLIVDEKKEHAFFKPKLIEKKIKNDIGSGSQGFNDIISQEPSGVLGLFEMMGKINKEATNNFDVVKIATAAKTETSSNNNKPTTTQQPLISFEEMKEKFRLHEIDKIKAQEEELRNQQMEKLKLFNLFQEEERLQKQREEQNQNKFSTANSFDSLQGWDEDDSWEKTIKSNDDKGDNKGVAYASITIENVDVDDARDYDVNNGIVRLRKGDSGMPEKMEYEYEYYEADPDDIKFPVGGTQQFYDTQAKKNINQISNKELLMNLLDASDNFQNREFLERLKNIVTGGGAGTFNSGETRERLLADVAENVLTGTPSQSQDMRSQDRWAPAQQLPSSPKTSILQNNANDLPIWPSSKNYISSPSLEKFEPINNQLIFPNRRMDSGVGSVSLVSDEERGQITSISGFPGSQSSQSSQSFMPSQSSQSSSHRISDRLDFTSDNEFVVGTSLSMNQGSFQPHNSNFGQTSGGGHFNSGVGFATPVPVQMAKPSIRTGTATPIRGSEVFRLGSGVQIQQPGGGGGPAIRENENQNYILPTFSHDDQAQSSAGSGEIYADIRLESGKKNLLTPHTDHHDLYIEPGRQPGAEVIVYPMGQLLANRQFLGGSDPMVMSGSSDDNIVMSETNHRRDQRPAFSYRDTGVIEESDQRKAAPNGLLETIIRTAKDDIDFAGNVLNFLTSSRSN